MRLIHPHEIASSVHAVDYARLARLGRRVLLFDLENTLSPYRTWDLAPQTWELLATLARDGFKLAVVSNAAPPPESGLVQGLRKLGVATVWRARKPARRGIQQALEQLGARPEEAVMVGDQLLTDVWAGQRAGIYTVLVTPLGPRESRFTKFNRLIERLLGRPDL